MYLCAALLSSLLLGLASGQGDLACTSLNVDRDADSPVPGTALDVCPTEESQCCTQPFLTGVKRQLVQDMLAGLRKELTNRVGDVADILDRFASYFEGDFINDIREHIPASQFLTSSLNDITATLTMFLERANFAISSASPERNTMLIFEDIVTQIENAIQGINVLPQDQKDCLVRQVRMHLDPTSLSILGQTLETVRRSFSGITRISQFLTRFNRTLDGFNTTSFPRECLKRLTELSVCGRCRQRIPPLCKNSCGALIRGCYAAFYSGLEQEFNNLWTVVRQLVKAAANAVVELFQAENNLLDISLLQVVRDCNLNLDFLGRRKRQASLQLPEAIMERAQLLTGVFKYASSGPLFCRVESDEEDFCRDANARDDRSCDQDKVCTSECSCWDGKETRDTDITEFTGVGIDEQGNNPVLQVPVEENFMLAKSRSSVVNSFLTSEEFMEVMPEGITIPPPAPFGDDGSVPLVSMVTILGTVLFALLMIST